MSQIANITVFDGAATPVTHTLVPVAVNREKGAISAIWREQITSLPVEAQISVEARLETLKSGVVRAEVKTMVPVMESVSGQNAAGYTAAPKVAYVSTYITTEYIHPRASIANNRTARQLHVNLQGSVSTSVAAVTTGPMPELFDLLVAPT